ncbi:uncharacterized protein LOC143613585 [Bidens hawaiensis]|uniref:uncharacterized protein LOC143613585 n=1 Tax=Bidens hawaiensis TaxID=980011 RepID=UPI00404B59DA
MHITDMHTLSELHMNYFRRIVCHYVTEKELRDSGSEDEVLFSAIRYAAQILVEHCESTQPRTRRPHLQRDRVGAHDRLVKDYFSTDVTFDSERFRHRFRMSRQVFLRIVGDLKRDFAFFQQREDERGKPGFSPMQKWTTAIHQLAYGIMNDAMEEYLKMLETVACEALYTFYECELTQTDIQKIYEVHQQRHGFPGMLGSLDCTHWDWEACQVTWQGQYHRSDYDGPTIIIEVVASFDLWIWHAFFGMPGANNVIAMINVSPIFYHLINGVGPNTSFATNDLNYEYEYYLVDDINPDWATLVRSFTCPTDDK